MGRLIEVGFRPHRDLVAIQDDRLIITDSPTNLLGSIIYNSPTRICGVLLTVEQVPIRAAFSEYAPDFSQSNGHHAIAGDAFLIWGPSNIRNCQLISTTSSPAAVQYTLFRE